MGKITKTYTIRSAEKKLLRNAIKANKSKNIKRRKLKKGTVIQEEISKWLMLERVMKKMTLMLLLQ